MPDPQELRFALALDGAGGAETLDFRTACAEGAPAGRLLWVHVHLEDEEGCAWVREESGIPGAMTEGLLAEDPRPRATTSKDALLVVLRGVNLNPGADPADMVSVRAWFEAGRVVTAYRRRVLALGDIRETLSEGEGPENSGDLLVALVDRLVSRMGDVLTEVNDEVDAIEDRILTDESRALRPVIAELRRRAISLRRHLAPQRDTIAHLPNERLSWLDDTHRMHLRELADRATRYVEDLDETRDRAAVAHEELTSRNAEQLNRNMYLLSIVAAVFLPLGLLTGLLGINVGGIPGSETPQAFFLVCGLLVCLAVFELWFFRRRGWL